MRSSQCSTAGRQHHRQRRVRRARTRLVLHAYRLYGRSRRRGAGPRAEKPSARPRHGARRTSGHAPHVILVTRERHCAGELLLGHAPHELGASIQAIVSNHAVLEPLVRRFDVPFHFVPHAGLTREAHESALLEAIEPYRARYLVLAKYMRILSPGFVNRYAHRTSTFITRFCRLLSDPI